MRVKATAILVLGLVLAGAFMGGVLVGLVGAVFLVSPPQATASEVPRDYLEAILPQWEDVPILVKDLEEGQDNREKYLAHFEKYGIENAAFSVYVPPGNAVCDSWCGVLGYVLQFKDRAGARSAFSELAPPNEKKCDRLHASQTQISTSGLGELAVAEKCSSGYMETFIYDWQIDDMVLGLVVTGFPDNVDEAGVKDLADRMQERTGKNFPERDIYQRRALLLRPFFRK